VLAQMGSFVPAKRAHIGVVDRLFSRVGAADDLARGRSTFMVEMVETAAILNQATERSLVILDEIGRGTATFDGLSIAWASIEHLHETNRCRALFATHYHELTALAAQAAAVFNATMRVKEWQGDVVFLHEVMPARPTAPMAFRSREARGPAALSRALHRTIGPSRPPLRRAAVRASRRNHRPAVHFRDEASLSKPRAVGFRAHGCDRHRWLWPRPDGAAVRHRSAVPAALQADRMGRSVAEAILYCLWDMGLKVGHATRSIDESIRQARADMTIRTALLEARFWSAISRCSTNSSNASTRKWCRAPPPNSSRRNWLSARSAIAARASRAIWSSRT
jgi:hypothetical protein